MNLHMCGSNRMRWLGMGGLKRYPCLAHVIGFASVAVHVCPECGDERAMSCVMPSVVSGSGCSQALLDPDRFEWTPKGSLFGLLFGRDPSSNEFKSYIQNGCNPLPPLCYDWAQL
eukprot:1157476-Pelagomonas_calceolata.AAC.2